MRFPPRPASAAAPPQPAIRTHSSPAARPTEVKPTPQAPTAVTRKVLPAKTPQAKPSPTTAETQATPVSTSIKPRPTCAFTATPQEQVTCVVPVRQVEVTPVVVATEAPQVQIVPVVTATPEGIPPSLPITGSGNALETVSGALPLAALLLLAAPALMTMRSRGR